MYGLQAAGQVVSLGRCLGSSSLTMGYQRGMHLIERHTGHHDTVQAGTRTHSSMDTATFTQQLALANSPVVYLDFDRVASVVQQEHHWVKFVPHDSGNVLQRCSLNDVDPVMAVT